MIGDPKDLADQRYDAIDSSIRGRISAREFAWLPDAQKATLERDETEPEF